MTGYNFYLIMNLQLIVENKREKVIIFSGKTTISEVAWNLCIQPCFNRVPFEVILVLNQLLLI